MTQSTSSGSLINLNQTITESELAETQTILNEIASASTAQSSPTTPDKYKNVTSRAPRTDRVINMTTFFNDPRQIMAIISTSFSGRKEELQNFLRQCDLAMNECQTEWKHSLLVFICSRIKDEAGIELAALSETPQDWPTLRKFLIQKYQERETFEQIYAELTNISQKQNEDVAVYASRIQNLIWKAKERGQNHPELDKATIAKMVDFQGRQRLIDFCAPEISQHLRCVSGKMTFQEALSKATLEETKIRETRGKFRTPRYCSNCKTNTHNTAECRSKNPTGTKFCTYCKFKGHTIEECRRKKRETPTETVRQVQTTDLSDKKVCKYCKKENHVISECRKLKWKREQEKKDAENKPSEKAPEFKVRALRSPVSSLEGKDVKPNIYVELLNCINNQKMVMQVDTGAEISVMSKKALPKGIEIDNTAKKFLKGIDVRSSGDITEGAAYVPFSIGKKEFDFRFQIINSSNIDVPYNGMIGGNLCRALGTMINYNKCVLTFPNHGVELPFFYEDSIISIPPLTKQIVSFKTKSGKGTAGQIGGKIDLPKGIQVIDAIYKVGENSQAQIMLLNHTQETIHFVRPEIQLVPVAQVLSVKLDTNESKSERKTKLFDALRLDHLSTSEREKFCDLIFEFQDVFFLPGDRMETKVKEFHEINTTDEKPAFAKNYRFPQIHKKEVETQMAGLLEQNIIRPSTSPWNAPIWIVPKKADASKKQKWRIVVDYRKLNEKTIDDRYPLPLIDEILDQLGSSKFFTTLDLASGFHQIPIKKGHESKTAFSTHEGHYEFVKMPFGLKNAPATFQRIINQSLSGLVGNECFVYLDDIVIYSTDIESHLKRLRNIFMRLRQNGFLIQPDKSEFLKTEICYLGHIISDDGIRPNPSKIEAIRTLKAPSNVKEIQQFLGMAGYYRKFIPNFSTLAKPLSSLLKKHEPFIWTSDHENSFKQLVELLTSDLLLKFPNFEEHFYLNTDASDFAIGSVLSQKNEEGDMLPIAYASRTLNKAEVNYSTIEKELLAIVWSVKHFRPYLFGRKFTILSDHKPLQWLFNVNDPGSRLLRWRLKLAEHDYTIQHISGTSNQVADSLSRIRRIQTRSYTRKNPPSRPFEEKPFASSKNIAVFISPETINDNPITSSLTVTVREKGEIQHIKTKKRNIYVVLYRKSKSEAFSQSYFQSVLRTLNELLIRNGETTVGIYDDSNNLDLAQKSKAEQIIRKELEEIEPYWIFVGKIPENKTALIKQYHDHKFAGHQGVEKCYRMLLGKGYYWIGLKKDIREVIQSCDTCQKVKPNRHPTKPPMVLTDTAMQPFEKIAMDTVGPLPETKTKYRFVISLQDNLTKFVWLKAVKNHTTDAVVLVLSEFCLLFATPQTILTDQGTEFCSDIMDQLAYELQIRKVTCTPYHPESNGALERSHGTIKTYIKSYLDCEKSDWDVLLPFAASWYNKSWHEALGYSPFEVLYGFKPPLPIDPEPLKTIEQYVHERQGILREHYVAAHNRQNDRKIKTKASFDKNSSPVYYKEGDQVLLQNMLQTNKLNPKFKGPYTVVSTKGPNVDLLVDKDRIKSYHTKLIKPYYFLPSLVWALLAIGLLSAALGDTITPLNDTKGLFFFKRGKAFVQMDDWNIVTSFNLSIIHDRIDQLRDFEQVFRKYEPIMTNSQVNASIAIDLRHLEDQFELLASTTENSRVKRGLVDGVGKLNKWLWGTLDAEDGKEFSARIDKITGDSATMQDLLQHQIQIVNTSINNFERNTRIFDHNTRRISHMIESIQEVLVQGNTSEIRNHFYTTYQLFHIQRLQVQSEIEVLQTAILLAKRNILHPIVITANRLLHLLRDVKLPPQRIFPLPLTTAMSERYMDLGTVHTEVRNMHLFFYLIIPLTKDTEYSLYSILSLPSQSETDLILHYVPITNRFLLINPLCTQYDLFNEDVCQAATKNVFLCHSTTLAKVPFRPAICELQLFLGYPAKDCKLAAIHAKTDVWHSLGENQWLFSTEPGQRLSVSFSNGTIRHFVVPSQGILRLPHGAEASVGNHLFHGTSVFNVTVEYQFSHDPTLPPPRMPEVVPSLEAPTLELLDTHVFDELHDQLNRQQQHLDSLHAEERQSFLTYAFGGISISTWFIIIGAALLFFYLRNRGSSSRSSVPPISVNVADVHCGSPPVPPPPPVDIPFPSPPPSCKRITFAPLP